MQNYPAVSKWNYSTYSHAKYRDGTMVNIRNYDACLCTCVISPSKSYTCFLLTTLLSCRGMLHSNPMDYAWGANGLDAIITQVYKVFSLHYRGAYQLGGYIVPVAFYIELRELCYL